MGYQIKCLKIIIFEWGNRLLSSDWGKVHNEAGGSGKPAPVLLIKVVFCVEKGDNEVKETTKKREEKEGGNPIKTQCKRSPVLSC